MTELTTQSVEIAENTYWIGRRDPGAIFYANPYLRIFPGKNNRSDFHMLIDPGASADFSVVQSKTTQLIGSLASVRAIWINHQDPDVASVTGPLLQRWTPRARVLCSEETWRLVRFFNIPQERYLCMDPYKHTGLELPSGQRILPVPSPYCHFVGAMMVYDLETRVLFSGDLFGGLTAKNAVGLYADESDWTGMRAFHQLYMPAKRALKYTMEAIRALNPAPLLIAPQHGRVIQGDFIQMYIERLSQLDVGIDLLDDRDATEDTLHAWSSVLGRVIATAHNYLGGTAESRIIDDPELRDVLAPSNNGLKVTRLGKWAVERATRLLTEHELPEVANTIRYEAVFAAAELELPAPNVELTEEASLTAVDDGWANHAH